jgi:hypothetical protein
MIVPWLTFIVVGLVTYAGFVKLAARLLRYSISWKAGFLFAGIVLVLVIFAHVLAIGEPATIRTGQGVALLLCVFIVGGWFFSERGTNYSGTVVGLGGGLRLVALAFAMMVIAAFAIAIPIQLFLTKNVSPSP